MTNRRSHASRPRAVAVAGAPALLVLVLAALVSAALRPAPLAAQGRVLLEASAARGARASTPTFGGLALTSYRGPLGLRLGGAVHLRWDAGEDQAAPLPCTEDGCPPTGAPRDRGRQVLGYGLAAWTADADIVVEPFRPIGVARALLLGFSPYAFVGLGGRGVTPRWAPDTSIATASWGAGVHHQLLGMLTVGAEARYRRAIRSDSAITLGARQGLEYRVALGLDFGGGRRRMRSDGALAPAASIPSCAGDCSPRSVERREFAARTVTRVLDAADGLVGTPYRAGGDDARRGFDAPGFVRHVFDREHVRLPATVARMLERGAAVSTGVGSLRPGDLLFFASDGEVPDHVAIYVGHDRVVHAIASGGRVRYDVLGEGRRGQWLAERLVAARRVVTGDEMRLQPRRLDR